MATYRIKNEADKAKVLADIKRAPTAPKGFNVTCTRRTRTHEQNDRLHAMIRPISKGLSWHGKLLSVDDWKLVFMDALNREMRVVPNIDGNGFVQVGRKTSRLSVSELSDLMALIEAFAAQHEINIEHKGGACAKEDSTQGL